MNGFEFEHGIHYPEISRAQMRKEDVENLILTRNVESGRGRGKQHIPYLTNLCKCFGNTRSRRDSNKSNFTESYKRQEIVETHNRPPLEESWRIEESTYSHQSNLLVLCKQNMFKNSKIMPVWDPGDKVI